jgi:hypothetical protein
LTLTFQAVPNQFYDNHGIIANYNMFPSFVQFSCTVICNQSYSDTGAGLSASASEHRWQMMEPLPVGKVKARARSPSPIHSSISSVVAEISTGSQPIPSISSMRFLSSTEQCRGSE